jgi:hypothetical protein
VSQPLQRLNDKHRTAARMMARGMSLVEISRELGYRPNYWSRLKNGSPVFQECLAHYRRQAEQAYADGLERMYSEMFRLDELHELRNRRGRRRAAGSVG